MAQTANLPALKSLQLDVARRQPEFAKALPGHITPERFVRTAQTAIALTRNIEKADPSSLMSACAKAASDGLILDGREAALVVDYQGNVQYRPMMRGLLKLAYQSGQIKSIVVETVREADAFTYSPTNGTEPIHHEINLKAPRGEVYAAYAKAELKDGGLMVEVMTVEDINRIRDRSDAFKAFKSGKIKSTPWSTDWSEMARKTVFRRLSKYLPSSTDRDRFHEAAERIDEDYSFEIEGEASEPDAPAVATTKRRGGAAARLKDVTPRAQPKARQARKPEPEPEAQDDGEDYDPETGEFAPDSAYEDDMQARDDI